MRDACLWATSESSVKAVFVAHALTTLYMVGVIWMVQLVHYPLMDLVGARYVEYQRLHMDRMGLVVVLPMCVEALSAALLLRETTLPLRERIVAVVLLAVVWGVTFFVSVPMHAHLAQGFDAESHATLVRSNWARTLAWSARGALVGTWLWRAL